MRGVLVRNTKIMDFPSFFEILKGFGDFGRVQKRVGAVKDEQVKVIGFQAFQDRVYRAEDIGFREVIANGVAVALPHFDCRISFSRRSLLKLSPRASAKRVSQSPWP